MARAVPVHFPFPARLERAGSSFGRVTALGALVFLLATLGSLVFRAADRLRLALAAWSQARRERAQDRQLWELALTDSRVMADLIAVSQQVPLKGSRYF